MDGEFEPPKRKRESIKSSFRQRRFFFRARPCGFVRSLLGSALPRGKSTLPCDLHLRTGTSLCTKQLRKKHTKKKAKKKLASRSLRPCQSCRPIAASGPTPRLTSCPSRRRRTSGCRTRASTCARAGGRRGRRRSFSCEMFLFFLSSFFFLFPSSTSLEREEKSGRHSRSKKQAIEKKGKTLGAIKGGRLEATSFPFSRLACSRA